jgi:alkylation response protein AidB-like acyl-CoA dehydrogenase
MICFRLDDEQEALRSTVEDFARKVVAPVIGGFYERGEFPSEIVARMGKFGLFGLPFPEKSRSRPRRRSPS